MNRCIFAFLASLLLLPACDRARVTPPDKESVEEKSETAMLRNAEEEVQLFDEARKQGDEPEMARLMELVEKAAGADSAEYRYCRAAKIIWDFAQGKATSTELAEAKTLLKAAEETRPNWPNIPLGLAEVSLMEGNYDAVIHCLQRVDELGALTLLQLDLLVKLLNREGRHEEIKELLERKQGMPMTEDTLRIYEDVKEGKKVVKSVPLGVTTAEDYLWAGRIAMREKDYPPAESLFRRAVKLDPQNRDGWLGLLEAMKAQNAKPETLEKTVAEMREALQEVPVQK